MFLPLLFPMSPVFLLLPLLFCCFPSPLSAQPSVVDISPQQLHISLGYHWTTMVVQWMTWGSPISASVRYGFDPSSMNWTSSSTFHVFTDGAASQWNRTVHSATLSQLLPSRHYSYQILCTNTTSTVMSDVHSFNTLSLTVGTGTSQPLRIGMIGDYGLVNGDATHQSLERLSQAGGMDLLIHVGDFAYDMADFNGTRGDAFMQREEKVIAHLPYMTAVGNHESAYNFSHYTNRFVMPNVESGSPTPLYYSFNVGPVHFISIDVERYFYTQYYTLDHLRMQMEWLEADLEKNAKDDTISWIVAYAHRPMYCTHIYNDWNQPYCTENAASVRDGVAFKGGARQFGLEKLFYKYKVDLYVSGHMHSYERTYPVYREQVMDTHYHGNHATLHIIAGAAGCQEYLDTYDENTVYPWSATRSDSYGYGVFTVYNATHAHWAQILDEDESVLDQVWVTKDVSTHNGDTATVGPAPAAPQKARKESTLRGRHA